MIRNRSMPDEVLIPVIGYPSIADAIAWLTDAFGFSLRWRVGSHRAQLAIGPSAAIAIVVGEPATGNDHVMVRVDDIAAHRARAEAAGATVSEVGEFPYGERQYSAVDFAGRRWVFSESIADVAPGDWGATTDPADGMTV